MDNEYINNNNESLSDNAIQLFNEIYDKSKEVVKAIINNEDLQKATETIVGLRQVFAIYKTVKGACGLRDQFYLNKIMNFFAIHNEIPEKSRRKFQDSISKEQFNKYSTFIFEILDKTEEQEKIRFYTKLCQALYDEIIEKSEFRRFLLMTKNTPYVDLLHLEHQICSGTFDLYGENQESLLANGWILFVPFGQITDKNYMSGKTGYYKYAETTLKYCKIVFDIEEIPENSKYDRAITRLS